jgi:hypothetical protein
MRLDTVNINRLLVFNGAANQQITVFADAPRCNLHERLL